MSWLTICIWAVWTIVLGLVLWDRFPGPNGESLALWFQAIGAIGAIFVAFWAVAAQRREKRQSIVAVAAAAAEHARRIGDALEQDSLGHLPMYTVYDQSIVDGMVQALTNAPVHEVGSPDGVIALLALRDQFAWLGVQMKEYLGGPWKHEELRKAIESCGDDREAQRTTIETGEKVLKSNVRMRLEQIQRRYSELKATVGRV